MWCKAKKSYSGMTERMSNSLSPDLSQSCSKPSPTQSSSKKEGENGIIDLFLEYDISQNCRHIFRPFNAGRCGNQGCGAVTFLVGSGSGSGSGAAFRLWLRLRLRVKLFGGSGSGQNVPAPAAPAPAPAPMVKSSYEPKPAIRFSKMPNVKYDFLLTWP